MYLGFDNLFAVYQAGQQEVAVNLKFDFAIQASDLTAAMPSPEEYKARNEVTRQSVPEVLASYVSPVQPTDWNWISSKTLNMRYYRHLSSGRKWCGPCSGVSIGRYYREERGYSNLPATCNYYNSCYNVMYDELYTSMKTFLGYTDPLNYGPGFVKMTQNCGYTNFNYVCDDDVTSQDYWAVVVTIDVNCPTALAASRFYDDIGGDPYFPPTKKPIGLLSEVTGGDMILLPYMQYVAPVHTQALTICGSTGII